MNNFNKTNIEETASLAQKTKIRLSRDIQPGSAENSLFVFGDNMCHYSPQ